MKNTKRLVGAVLLTTLLATLMAVPLSVNANTGAAAPHLQADDDWAKVKAAGKLMVGTAADYAPFEFYNSNSQVDGFDIALMNEIGKRLGVTIEFNDFAFNGVLTALRLKQVDAAIAGISVTPDRRALVDFSNLYYIGNDAALVRSDFSGTIRSVSDLGGYKVGVQKGTTYEGWVKENAIDKGILSQSSVLPYDDASSLVQALRDKKVDVVFLGLQPAQSFDTRFADIRIGGQNFNQQKFAMATRTGSTLTTQLNTALLQVQSDGTFAKLVTQYLGVKSSEITPTGNTGKVDNSNDPPANPPPACEYGAAYVADLNLDDQNMTAPPILQLQQAFSKGWRLRNSGTCAWGANFSLGYVNGNRAEAQMNGQPVAIGRAVQPGETVDLSVNLTAPGVYGVFQGFWAMRDGNGQQFGEVVWVGIQIPDPNPPPQPTAPPPPPPNVAVTSNLRADSNPIVTGQCTTVRWDVVNGASAWWIDGPNVYGVNLSDSRTVCPQSTAYYALRVLRLDNVQQDFPISIQVISNQTPSINFWVDSANINVGQCTTLRWNVTNVNAVYLNDQGVAGQSNQQICPQSTQTYTLRVVRNDGSQDVRQVTVNVGNGPAPQPTIIPLNR